MGRSGSRGGSVVTEPESQREMTFEEMCLDAIERGHRRNVEYFEQMQRSEAQGYWLLLGTMITFFVAGVVILLWRTQ